MQSCSSIFGSYCISSVTSRHCFIAGNPKGCIIQMRLRGMECAQLLCLTAKKGKWAEICSKLLHFLSNASAAWQQFLLHYCLALLTQVHGFIFQVKHCLVFINTSKCTVTSCHLIPIFVLPSLPVYRSVNPWLAIHQAASRANLLISV